MKNPVDAFNVPDVWDYVWLEPNKQTGVLQGTFVTPQRVGVCFATDVSGDPFI
jgi:hypothetical protein